MKSILTSLVVLAWLGSAPVQASDFGVYRHSSHVVRAHGSCRTPRAFGGYRYGFYKAPRKYGFGSYWGPHPRRRHHDGHGYAPRGRQGHGKHRKGDRHHHR